MIISEMQRKLATWTAIDPSRRIITRWRSVLLSQQDAIGSIAGPMRIARRHGRMCLIILKCFTTPSIGTTSTMGYRQ